MRLSAHSPTRPAHRRDVRLTLVVVLVLAASVLLAAPGTASGLTKSQKDYLRIRLSLQEQRFTGELSLFETWRETAQMNRDDLEDLLNANNPGDQAEIQSYESWGADFATQVRKKVATDRGDAIAEVNKLYAKAKPWFKSKSDRRDLREGATSLRGAFDALYDAYTHLGLAADALSRDDFAQFDGEMNWALGARDLAVSLSQDGLEKLRALL